MNNIINFSVVLLLLTSCADSLPKKNVQQPELIAEVKEPKQKEEALVEEIVYDTIYCPNWNNFEHSNEHSIKIVSVSNFHGDELWDGVENEDWYGLFKTKDSTYIAKVQSTFSRVYDIVLDENESQKTGWEVSIENKDTCIILIAGVENIAVGKLNEQQLSQPLFCSGTNYEFNFLGTNYELITTGGGSWDPENQWCDSWNYKLFLKSNEGKVEVVDTLLMIPSFRDAFVRILFSGDIDGDGKLDLLIDSSNHYNGMRPTLYLSSFAKNGQLLKLVALHESVGC